MTIDGGEGNDYVYNDGNNVTIEGGTGNDSIHAYGNLIQLIYRNGDGNDNIYGFNENSRLSILDSKYFTAKGGIYDEDIIVNVGSDSITLHNAAYLSKLNISDKISSTSDYSWKLDGTTATYGSSNETLATVSGVKSLNGVSLKDKVITVSNAALSQGTVSISGNGYSLALGKDVDITKESISKWTTFKGGNVAYQTGGTGSYYALNSRRTSVIYNAAKSGSNKVEFSGVKGTPTLSGSTVKLTANNFKSNVSVKSNSGKYTFLLSGKIGGKTFTGTSGADKINSSGSNVVISGGKGNDTATLGSGNTYLYAKGDGNDTLYSFGNDDKIKLTGTTKAKTKVSGKDVIVTTDGGSITVENAATNKKVTIVNSKGKTISAYTYSADKIVDGNSVTLTSAFKGILNATYYTKVDGSGVANAIKIIGGSSASTLTGGAKNDSITGGKANDKLYGGAGNDTLTGGKGNDSLWGDAGKDTFIYAKGDGRDIIYGFEDIDMLKITGKFSSTYNKRNKEIALTVGKTTSVITLKDFSATSFNINGSNYKISGTALKKK